jgi:threonine synthase
VHPVPFHNTCSECKTGILEFVLDELGKEDLSFGIWKHSSYLPYFEEKISLGEANTPLVVCKNFFGPSSSRVLFKCEYANSPTGTFRDRTAALIVSAVKALKEQELVVASTGSMGVSIAAYSAAMGIKSHVFLPDWSDTSKRQHVLIRGADLRIGGKTFQDTVQAAELFANRNGFLNVTADITIYTVEAQKTISFEIFESSLVDLQEEDVCIVIPSGSGSLVYSLYKGFLELKKFGKISSIPRLVAVQIKKADPFVRHYIGQNSDVLEETGMKIAPELFIHVPTFLDLAVEAIRKTDGEALSVDPGLILKSLRGFSRKEGIYVETSSILPVIAVSKLLKKPKYDKTRFIMLLTGSGLAPSPYLSENTRYKLTRRSRYFSLASTKLEIVRTLSESDKKMSGKEIWISLGQVISHQAVYKHLKELENSDYIRFEPSPSSKRKLWSLTELGRQLLN